MEKEEQKITFTPIAMKCNQEQFDDIKPLLKSVGYKIFDIDNFDKYEYLTNNYIKTKNDVSNIHQDYIMNYGRKVYHEWDKKIFLNACGIEWVEPLKNDIVEEVINNFEKELEHDPLDDLPIIGNGVLMKVSMNEIDWSDRYVIGKTISGKFLAWVNAIRIDTYLWNQARPITPKTKITRKEFEQKFEIID